MSTQPTQNSGRRYVWMVIAPLIIVVLGSLYTIKLAVESDEAELPIDLTKTGKALDHTPAQKAALREFAGARATLDSTSNQLELHLFGLELSADAITARLVHPTQPERDAVIQLQRTQTGYAGQSPTPIPIRGRLLIQPTAEKWVIGTIYKLDDTGKSVVRFGGS